MANSDGYIIGADYGIYVGSAGTRQTGTTQTIPTTLTTPTTSEYSSFEKNLRRGGVTSTLDDKTNYQFFDQVVDTNTYTAHPEEKKNNTIIIMGAAAVVMLLIIMKQ